MKSLTNYIKEGILNSVGAGKKARLTVGYLLKNGWKEDKSKQQIISPDKNHTLEYNFDDVIFAKVNDFVYSYRCRIRTLEDFERLKQFWNEFNEAYKRNPWNEDKKTSDAQKAVDDYLKYVKYYTKTKFCW